MMVDALQFKLEKIHRFVQQVRWKYILMKLINNHNLVKKISVMIVREMLDGNQLKQFIDSNVGDERN